MEIRATLRPGQNGTKRLLDKYGDRLLCVRYRYDSDNGKRYTTVELIEETADWSNATTKQPSPHADASTQRLGIRVHYWETDLRDKVKEKGGIWRPAQKLWEMRYQDVVALGLESRVVTKDNGGKE